MHLICPLSCVGPLAGVKQSHSLPAVVRVEKGKGEVIPLQT